MPYCTKCGKKINEGTSFCSECGQALGRALADGMGLDSNERLLITLGNFCVSPILGIILYFVWKDKKPQKSREVGKITLWVFGVWAVFAILYAFVTVLTFSL
jgi:uncharacterized membrane protein YvbJ